jgi:hypothetical protein
MERRRSRTRVLAAFRVRRCPDRPNVVDLTGINGLLTSARATSGMLLRRVVRRPTFNACQSDDLCGARFPDLPKVL